MTVKAEWMNRHTASVEAPARGERPRDRQVDRTRLVEDAYLPLRALSGYSGLSIRTLREHLVHVVRPLPHYRVGGKILVRRSEFDSWITKFREVPIEPVSALIADVLEGL
jgi:hypothetical protein